MRERGVEGDEVRTLCIEKLRVAGDRERVNVDRVIGTFAVRRERAPESERCVSTLDLRSGLFLSASETQSALPRKVGVSSVSSESLSTELGEAELQ